MHWRWILFAAGRGDKTYKEFTGGKTVNTPVVTYHFLAENLPIQNIQLSLNKDGQLEQVS
jgi:hypothetical protein